MGPPGHPGAPLAGLASLGLTPPGQKDWDNMSVYRWGDFSLSTLKHILDLLLSQKTDRSVNRARMYHMDPRQGEDIKMSADYMELAIWYKRANADFPQRPKHDLVFDLNRSPFEKRMVKAMCRKWTLGETLGFLMALVSSMPAAIRTWYHLCLQIRV